MPDLSAIEAVLYYEQHDFFYFAANPQSPGFHNLQKHSLDTTKMLDRAKITSVRKVFWNSVTR